MKRISLFLTATLAVSLALPTFAQEAPTGWKTQTKANGAKTFTPPDLKAGEIYSVTIYDPTPLGGKSLEAWLRAFGGTVGTKPGQLAAPLKIKAENAQVVSGIGAYSGPNGTVLNVVFLGVSFDGKNISVSRTLLSNTQVLDRYQKAQSDLLAEMGRGARKEVEEAKGPRQRVDDEPQAIADVMKVGGAIVPGMYEGFERRAAWGSVKYFKLRVYLYANGEYRVTDDHDEDFKSNGDPLVGKFKYNAKRGLLDVGFSYHLQNDNSKPYDRFCYYGVDFEGTPCIRGYDGSWGLGSATTTLFWKGPPTGRKSQSEEDAPALALEAKKKAVQDKLNRIQTRVAPGQGVPASQVAAVMHNYDSQLRQTLISPGGSYIIPNFNGPATYGYNAPIYGLEQDITNDTFLLLRDGTIYRGLEWAPDQFDIRASRRKEPENWGLWKSEGGKIQMSFAGQPYEEVPGKRVSPNPAQARLNGRYICEGGNISFSPEGRFKRSPLSTKDDPSAKYTVTKSQKAGGDSAGTYSINGYSLTLRYDSGKVERMLFFPEDASRKSLWFEGGWIGLDKAK